MSLIRPEARAALWRWREVMAACAMALLGGWWALRGFGAMALLGWALLLLGALALIAGLQRARVRPRAGGAGVIELDEGQLAYLHPAGGGMVALPAVIRIEIETTGAGPADDDLFWRFTESGGHMLRIPAAAVGAEKLLDALASFPGADYQKVIMASGITEPGLFEIWRKPVARLH